LDAQNELPNIVQIEDDLEACAEKIARFWTAQEMLNLFKAAPAFADYSNKEPWTLNAAAYYSDYGLGGPTFTEFTIA